MGLGSDPRVGVAMVARRARLRAEPRRLRDAVGRLPDPKGSRSETRLPIAQLRQRLLEVAVEDLAAWKLRPKARAALPYLAVETRNAALRERIALLSVREAPALDWPTAGRLYPFLHEVGALRDALRARLAEDPPGPGLPRWLGELAPAAFEAEDPAHALARRALQVPLAQVAGWLGLSPLSPLGTAVLDACVRLGDDAWLAAQPYTETLRWIERSSGPAAARLATLRRILSRYLGPQLTPADLVQPGPLTELLDLAQARLGGWPHQRPGPWRRVPHEALRAAVWLRRIRRLDELFADAPDRAERLAYWGQWVDRIRAVEPLAARDAVALTLPPFVLVESLRTPATCTIVDLARWPEWQAEAPAERQPRPLVTFELQGGGREEMDTFIRIRSEAACPEPPDAPREIE